MIDVVLFNKYKGGNLYQLGWKATDKEIMEVDGATMRLVNKKSGHKNSCVQHQTNGESYLNLVRALGMEYVHLGKNRTKMDCLMS